MSFTFCPNEVFQDDRLSKIQLRVLLALFSFRDNKSSNTIHPKRDTLIARIGSYSTEVISRTTSQLVELGWLSKAENNGGFSRSAIYKLHVPELLLKTVTDSDTVTDSFGYSDRFSRETVTDSVNQTVTDSVRGNKQTNKQTIITNHNNIAPTTEKPARKPQAASAQVAVPSFIPAKLWENVIAHRKSKKQPVTQLALEAVADHLAHLHAAGEDLQEVVMATIRANYPDFYPVRKAPPAAQSRATAYAPVDFATVGGSHATVTRF
ncbi:hypothetical protein J9253_05995 [Thiothrix litoralis]|uniref:Helix-turn-helix domain-containing protein n=1 Tax=Thiothrix litoralis TaxID=2891210 RepID=A0ABX7WUI7_9GAMM|nr:hypothetical protein [Thiothrix litoralis]QTR47484.1 hypothetical protein J9253_05995 [Thiothrix litoralis]